MKIKLTENQFKRVILQESVISAKDEWVKDIVKDITPPSKEGFSFKTLGEVISKWPKNNEFYGYHNDPHLKNLPFLKEKSVDQTTPEFKDKFPVIVVTNYGYDDKDNNSLLIKKINPQTGEYERVEYLFGDIVVTDLHSDPICRNNKKLGSLINACINWKEELVPVGTYANSSGKNRKDGCEKGKKPEWLFGCGDHPYKSIAYLHPEAAQSFKKMNAEYKKRKGKDIKINSAYRDVFHQGGVDSAGKPKAKGGRSNHGFGLALDINIRNRPWMKKNGGKYGWCWYGSGDRPHFNYFPLLDKSNKNYTCANSEEAHKQYEKG